MKHSKKLISFTLVASVLCSSLLVTGCNNKYMKKETSEKTVAVTIGDKDFMLSDVKPAIALTEITKVLNYYNQMQYFASLGYSLGEINIDSMWTDEVSEEDAEEGEIGADYYRDQAIDKYCEQYILNQEAKANKDFDVEISDDLKKRFTENAKTLVDSMSDKMIEKTGLTVEDFEKYQEMVYVYNNYYEHIIDGFKVTEKDVEADYDFDNEYRQYNTQYVTIPLATTDSKGNSTAISDDEKKAAKETLTKALADLKAGKKLAEVAETYKDNNLTASSSAKTYTQADAYPEKVPVKEDDSKEDEKSEDTSKEDSSSEKEKVEPTTDEYYINTRELKNGEYSDIFEYDNAYYIVYMEENKSTEAYDSAISTAMSNLEKEKYTTYYEDLKSDDKYKISVNTEITDQLKMGELVLDNDEVKKALGLLD